ncbi:MAG: hypothetical protein IJQ45_02655 [Clostridia bacterium]|nr:hypothetical protein [Clostridia bacterium]
MNLTELAKRLEDVLTEYQDAIAEQRQMEKAAEALARQVNDRISEERSADAERTALLKRKCENSPRDELLQIVSKLDQVDQQSAKTSTSSWLRFYRGGAGQETLTNEERRRLERRRRELEMECALTPATDSEIEILTLQRKTYAPSPVEQQEAAQIGRLLTEAHNLALAAQNQLQDALGEFDEAMKPLRWSLRLDEADRTVERPYRAALDALDAVMRA